MEAGSDGWMKDCKGGLMGVWIDGGMGEWMDGWTDGKWMDGELEGGNRGYLSLNYRTLSMTYSGLWLPWYS